LDLKQKEKVLFFKLLEAFGQFPRSESFPELELRALKRQT